MIGIMPVGAIKMRGWWISLREAVRANPRLAGTLAVEAALLFYATLKARRGRAATMPPVETVIEALPVMAAAAVGAPAIAGKKSPRRGPKRTRPSGR